jgi:2-polyprenyl-6-methoxyphenol hydroxylase-like FAD-dependent oxidoreductase
MRAQHTEVLVVGAGPVGMFAALLLAREGVKVQIIDEASGPAGHSYACGLHSRTLTLLREAGLHASLVAEGRRINDLAIYEGLLRRAEIAFQEVSPDMPYMVVLPQDSMESALEEELRQDAHVNVLWNHRLMDLSLGGAGVTATVDELSGTATGYDVPRWEMVVKRSFQITADYVIGCDGQRSAVRRLAAIPEQTFGQPQTFVVYEFDSDFEMPDEIRLVLNPNDTNVLWPLPDSRFRWSFQWTKTADAGDFPGKHRSHLWFEEKSVAQRTEEHLKQMVQQRAPWFTGSIDNMDWATDVTFQRRLVRQFGKSRCWLAGDAAHQTGPAGMQSMNLGLREAAVLARQMKKAIRDGSTAALEEYEDEFLCEWQKLMEVTAQLERKDESRSPAVRNTRDLVACLPSSGVDLDSMLDELGLHIKAFCAPTAQRR